MVFHLSPATVICTAFLLPLITVLYLRHVLSVCEIYTQHIRVITGQVLELSVGQQLEVYTEYLLWIIEKFAGQILMSASFQVMHR